jgi:uncharacterized protein
VSPAEQAAVIAAAEQYARDELGRDGSGHDYWHVHRVRTTAVALAREEGADLFVTELTALLHDIADVKLSGSLTAGPDAARAFCATHGLPVETGELIASIIAAMSFKGALVAEADLPLEGRCVRDADRLDAIGAVGIARAFAYGGSAGRLMWDPQVSPRLHATEAAYRSDTGSSIAHFYEKLLLLKDRMGTDAGRRRAEHRHGVMESFLAEFYAEWDGSDGD